MRTNPAARYRHSIRSGKRDSASLYKKTTTGARRPWSIAELEASRDRALARGDVEFAAYRRQQIQVRQAQIELENAPQGQETPPEATCDCDTIHDEGCTRLSQAQQVVAA